MWFLLDCDQDRSLVIITQEDVTIGTTATNEGDTVQFRIGNRNKKKKWTGIILHRSEDRDELVERRKAIQASADFKKRMEAAKKLTENAPLPPKRVKRDVMRYSPSRSNNNLQDSSKVTKKRANKEKREAEHRANQAKSQEMEELFGSDSDGSESSLLDIGLQEQVAQKEKQLLGRVTDGSSDQSSSPTKDQLKKKLADAMALIKASQGAGTSSQASGHVSKKNLINDSDDESDSASVRPRNAYKKSNDLFGSCLDTEDVPDTASKENLQSSSPEQSCKDQMQTSKDSRKKEPKTGHGSAKKDLKEEEDEDVVIDGLEGLLDGGRQLQQLYGENYYVEKGQPDKKMKLLSDGVFCKESVLSAAIGGARRHAKSFLRNVILGVFKKEELVNATLTGQAPRAAGKVSNPEEIVPMDPIAVDVIIRYSIAVGRRLKWRNIPSRAELEKTFTQRVGEIKRSFRDK